MDAGASVEAVYVESGRHEQLLGDLGASGVTVRPVAPGVLDRVLSTSSPQGIAAVASRPNTDARLLQSGTGGVIPVLAGIGDPGNVGTIVRSAAASAAGLVIAGPRTADPFGPKAVRASVGTVFHVDVHEVEDLSKTLTDLRAAGHAVVGAAPRGGEPHDEIDLTGPTALVLGGETEGLPADVVAGDLVTIAQPGPVESMNVAMAATVLLFEAARQRGARSEMS